MFVQCPNCCTTCNTDYLLPTSEDMAQALLADGSLTYDDVGQFLESDLCDLCHAPFLVAEAEEVEAPDELELD
jgi:hypothetical protein